MRQALDMLMVGMCMLFMAYMVFTVLGYYDGKCIILLGVGILATWMLARKESE